MTRVYKCTGTVYSDQTGRFPFTLSHQNKYIMQSDSVTSRKDQVLIATHKKLIDGLKAMGIHLKMQHLDNKASQAYKEAIESCGMTYQLVTPHVHQANIAAFHSHRCRS
ncbi:hypothetical protein ACHAXN_012471 [Cyclotella atomus]